MKSAGSFLGSEGAAASAPKAFSESVLALLNNRRSHPEVLQGCGDVNISGFDWLWSLQYDSGGLGLDGFGRF